MRFTGGMAAMLGFALLRIRPEKAMRRASAIAAVFLLLGSWNTGPVHALSEVENPWERARALYGQGEFNEARLHIVEAIQRDPERAELYLGLARTLYQLGNFDEAVYVYDLYIQEFAPDDDAGSDARATHQRAVAERGGANREREEPNTRPEGNTRHRAARDRFVEVLRSGPAAADRGASAMELWEVLLRTGYARPDLSELRDELLVALHEEAMEAAPADAKRMPVLGYRDWGVQADRLRFLIEHHEDRRETRGGEEADDGGRDEQRDGASASESVRELEARLQRYRAMLATTRAQEHMLNMNADAAARHFSEALEADDSYRPALFGWFNARVEAPASSDREALVNALATLDEEEDAELDVLTSLYRVLLAVPEEERQRGAMELADKLIERTRENE